MRKIIGSGKGAQLGANFNPRNFIKQKTPLTNISTEDTESESSSYTSSSEISKSICEKKYSDWKYMYCKKSIRGEITDFTLCNNTATQNEEHSLSSTFFLSEILNTDSYFFSKILNTEGLAFQP